MPKLWEALLTLLFMVAMLAYLGVTVADSNGVRLCKEKKAVKQEAPWEE